MADMSELSEAKRALLEKYLRGELPKTVVTTSAGVMSSPTKVEAKVEAKAEAKAEVASPRERVVALQTGGAQRPLFFLHGQWDGKAFFCYPVAKHLGADQPLYVLEPYRLDDLAVLPSIEVIAAAHLKSLRAIQPEGPYLLAGWCNGALIAYEMAQQLHASGQTVDLLVLMDSVALVYPLHQRLYRAAFSRLSGLLGLSRERQLEWYLRLKYLARRSYRYVWYTLYKRAHDPEDLSFAAARRDYPRLFDWMALGYTPPHPYPGKITFFWAREGAEAEAFRKGWRHVEQGLAGNEVEIHILPGDHITCRTEHLDAFAEELRICVARAQVASGIA